MTPQGDDETTEIWSVPLAEMIPLWDPWSAWEVPRIERVDVEEAIKLGNLDPRCFNAMPSMDIAEEYHFHCARIAWLILNPDNTPIEIDVGCPVLGYSPRFGAFDMIDGNHRLAAADYRGDLHILVSYGGECDQMGVLFPGGFIAKGADQ